MRLKTTGKFGVVLQLAVLLLMQFSAVAHGLARSVNQHASAGQCRGDHVQCGCAPNRIASRSSCCYLNARPPAGRLSCCATSAVRVKQPASADVLDRSTPALGSLPCGGDPARKYRWEEPMKLSQGELPYA